jgi:hypothetical protein
LGIILAPRRLRSNRHAGRLGRAPPSSQVLAEGRLDGGGSPGVDGSPLRDRGPGLLRPTAFEGIMGTLIDVFVSALGLLLLLAVMAACALGIWRLARAGWPFSPPERLVVLPFDLLRADAVVRGQGEVVSRHLVATIRRIVATLGRAVDPAAGTGDRPASVLMPRQGLQPSLSAPIEIGISPIKFDVSGLWNLLSGLVSDRYVIRGVARITEQAVELHASAEFTGGEARPPVGLWAARSQRLEEAVEALAYAVAYDVWLSRTSPLRALGAEGVRSFVKGLEHYQSAAEFDAQQPGCLPWRNHLDAARVLFEGLAADHSCGLPEVYLGIIYAKLERKDEARNALERAVKKEPENRSARELLAKLGQPASGA